MIGTDVEGVFSQLQSASCCFAAAFPAAFAAGTAAAAAGGESARFGFFFFSPLAGKFSICTKKIWGG